MKRRRRKNKAGYKGQDGDRASYRGAMAHLKRQESWRKRGGDCDDRDPKEDDLKSR